MPTFHACGCHHAPASIARTGSAMVVKDVAVGRPGEALTGSNGRNLEPPPLPPPIL